MIIEKERVKQYIEKHPEYVISDIQRILMNERKYCIKLLEEMGELVWIDEQWIYKRDMEFLSKLTKKHKYPIKRTIILGFILLIGLAAGTYHFLVPTQMVSKVVNAEDKKGQIEKEIRLVEQNDEDMINTVKERYSKPEAAIDYLFGISMLGNVNMYPDAFTVEQFFKDINDSENGSKIDHVKDIMNRLTKNGTLTNTKIVKKKSVGERESRIVVDIYYKDLDEPIRVQIKVKKHVTKEKGNKQELYYISTSVWEIIKKIDKDEV